MFLPSAGQSRSCTWIVDGVFSALAVKLSQKSAFSLKAGFCFVLETLKKRQQSQKMPLYVNS
ncbi:hypothetical protein [Tychonema sp. LEGE 07203]|uniref:hypothetical protein n=1 Tax=Tychonema sp. LEGE 07203 TaxID=1828671 RepID=UPI001A066F7D|nr:hypothetical protein [Tychonema sp. LEGE 07203]MBE9092786.1 hypothetical protein [Tychonema sp. LEGE 07203]